MLATGTLAERALTRILIVEDEGVIAMDLQARLELLGYRVVGIAASADSAIQLATTELPDLVLMDIMLEGGSDGVTAAGTIRDTLSLPVIYVTSYSDDSTLGRARKTDPLGYISKPFTDRDLHTSIQMAIYRHQTEQAIIQQRKWLDSVLRSIADAVVATDAKGRVRLVNPVAERITGWREAEALGRPFSEVVELLDPAERVPVNPMLDALSTGVPVLNARFILRSRDLTEHIVEDSTATVSFGTALQGGVFVFRDITEKLRLERDLQQAQRMESLGRLAGGVAHDFNNLLTIIMTVSELGMSDFPANPDIRSRFATIAKSAQNAAVLTRRLLALGCGQVLNAKALDVNRLLRELTGVVRSVIPESVELILRASAAHAVVFADQHQFEDALINILLNARDAVGHSGRVVIATRDAQMPADASGNAGVPAIAIQISDSGPGIPEAIKSRIFEPFFTTKTSRAKGNVGTGLGLASAYSIFSQLGGRIDVESSPGCGATFTVLVPLLPDSHLVSPPVSAPVLPLDGEARILLVEDDDAIRELQRAVLISAGMRVDTSSDAVGALTVFERAVHQVDLLVTDVIMPGMTGVDLARRVFQIRPDLKVLFISGYTASHVRLGEFPPGSAAFLQKPFRPDELTAAVRALLESRH